MKTMQPKDYQDLNKLWGASPGFATTLFISWDDIGYIFDVDENWSLTKTGDPTPIDVMNTAFQEAQEWSIKYHKTYNRKPSEEEIIEIEDKISQSIMEHWSYGNVISQNVDFDALIEGLNQWCLSGPKLKEIFIQPPNPNIGLKHFINDSGISFTIYPAFIVPYIELYYAAYETLPEWNLEDLDGGDIAETIYLYADHIDDPVNLELSLWDTKREKY